ncbi:MAG: hypothetical protein K6G74_02000 [Bacilli bacterium]|nr:hypothetical protein [Bacilli bacterium]
MDKYISVRTIIAYRKNKMHFINSKRMSNELKGLFLEYYLFKIALISK